MLLAYEGSISTNKTFVSNLFCVGAVINRSNGGGVCIAISNKIVFSHCSDLENDLEMVWLRFKSPDNNTVYLGSA